EDDPSNLTYTFSRTGATTTELVVHYTVSGTAAQEIDYSASSPWSNTEPLKTIRFAPGSSTATLTLDPIADTALEEDETVSLTLATGNGYTIGTSASVTGLILNDDRPLVSLSVTPNPGVTEDGSANLIYTFSRTGPTTNTLTASFNIGGSASLFDGDYSQQGASSFTGTSGAITFAVGASTATLTIDPTTDPDPEPDESLILTLAGGDYTIGTPNAATGTIRNDDTTIEARGTSALLRRGDGQAFARIGTAAPLQISSPWGATVGSDTSAWQIIAADTVNGTNQLLWRNNSANFLHTWSLDANWNWTGSGGLTPPTSADGLALLQQFGLS
ncbi:MAG: hypothetical protein VKP63_03845, partial [Cyanobacteriota bacterium]|nr:hypothetical protein [Cyanobacteriota bacterium]